MCAADQPHLDRCVSNDVHSCRARHLEVSLSFDNAVVNAAILRKMWPLWRQRFITWGIAIAVFGMRIVFPLAIVAIIARIGPISALVMAATDPDNYSRV